MPRAKNVDLAAELGEEVDLTEEQANAARQIVVPPVVAPAAPAALAASQPVSITVADIQAIVASAIEASQKGTSQLAELITDGIAQARKPIPEKTDADFPRISTLNPLGERDHPRPGLKCKFFLGTRDAKGVVQRSYEWIDEDLSAYEQIALNTWQPMSKVIKLYGNSERRVEIIPTRNELTEDITRLVLVVPADVIEKKSQIKNNLPSILELTEQLTGHDYSDLSNDDLAWFMAQHRKKQYVATREAVAA